jgi:glyoxylase-like metal-dependent hydrolase (beta-lactamase superfamily II)
MKIPTYPFAIGAYQGLVLYDNAHVHSAQELIVGPSAKELEHITREYTFELDSIPVGYNNLLLRTGDREVLVDAGIRRPTGKLCLGLAELGIASRDIDAIVITHSDRDHIGGILDAEGEVSFPNARYVMLEDSWQHWSSRRRRTELARLNKWTKDRVQFAWETYSKIKDLVLAVKPGEEFVPGLRLFAAPGHRYDHSILKVTSLDEQLVHLSDALVHPLFMANRDWYSTYDANPTQAVETKIRLLELCASENALVFGSHFPFPGLGYVRQGHECWKWQPIDVA